MKLKTINLQTGEVKPGIPINRIHDLKVVKQPTVEECLDKLAYTYVDAIDEIMSRKRNGKLSSRDLREVTKGLQALSRMTNSLERMRYDIAEQGAI